MEPTQPQNIPQPVTAKPSNKKWILIIIGVIIILGAGVYYYLHKNTMDTQETSSPVENNSSAVIDTQPTSVKSSSDIDSAKAELLNMALIIKNKDVLKAKVYFEQNGMSDWVQIMSDNKAVALSRLEGLGQSTSLDMVTSTSINDSSIKWSTGEPLGDAKAVVFGDNFKTADGSLVCRQIIEQNSKGEWHWVGADCS